MAEKPSSQESLPLSQESFRQLFSLIECPLSNLIGDDGKISHMQDENYDALMNDVRITHSGCNGVETIDCKTVTIPTQYLPQRPISSLPASENWPGNFGFHVSFNDQKATKGASWIFSCERNKLYVTKEVPCPVNFGTIISIPEKDVFIRAMALFSASDHANEKVTRCVNHSLDELKNEVFEAEHFIRCESQNAYYENDQITGRHSVIVPYENPPAGQLYSTYLYKFMCFGSCAGGPNRRALMIVFTLERRGEVIGRQRIDLKVCACPVRDFRADNKAALNKSVLNDSALLNNKSAKRSNADIQSPNVPSLPSPKKVKEDNGKEYIICEKDKKCYKFLKRMQNIYKIYSAIKDEPQWKQFINVSSQSSTSGDETDAH